MAEELSDIGIEHFGSGPDNSPISADPTQLLTISKTMEAGVKAVLLGYDIHFSYTKQFKASSFLLNKVCHFMCNHKQIFKCTQLFDFFIMEKSMNAFVCFNIVFRIITTYKWVFNIPFKDCLYLACNEREVGFRVGPGCWRPGAGTIVPCVSMATGREPVFLGKPHERMLDTIKLKVPEMDLKKTVMIGDSLKTDIVFAHNCGIDSIMVLSGANKKEDIYTQPDANNLPTYIMDSIEMFKYC